jgi:hypothetical protein
MMMMTYHTSYGDLAIIHLGRQGQSVSACFLLVSCLAYCSTLKLEGVCSSEISLNPSRTTRHHIPADRTLHSHSCEKLKSNIPGYYSSKKGACSGGYMPMGGRVIKHAVTAKNHGTYCTYQLRFMFMVLIYTYHMEAFWSCYIHLYLLCNNMFWYSNIWKLKKIRL